jgi:hypothetical protein
MLVQDNDIKPSSLSIEVPTSPPIVIHLPSDVTTLGIVQLALICSLVWMVKRPSN